MSQESVFGSGLFPPMMELPRCIPTILSAVMEKSSTLPLLAPGTLALEELVSAMSAEKAGRLDKIHLFCVNNKIYIPKQVDFNSILSHLVYQTF